MIIPFADKSTKNILIINGAGGVGTIAIQLAKKLHGLTVVATASRPETIDICKGYGADFVIDHRKPLKDGLAAVGIKKVEYILNCWEADEHWDQFKDIIAPLGKLVVMSTRKPVDVAWGQVLRVSIFWQFMFCRPMFNVEPEKQHELLNKVAELLENGTLKPRLTEVRKWEDLPALHKLVEGNSSVGKYAFLVPQ